MTSVKPVATPLAKRIEGFIIDHLEERTLLSSEDIFVQQSLPYLLELVKSQFYPSIVGMPFYCTIQEMKTAGLIGTTYRHDCYPGEGCRGYVFLSNALKTGRVL